MAAELEFSMDEFAAISHDDKVTLLSWARVAIWGPKPLAAAQSATQKNTDSLIRTGYVVEKESGPQGRAFQVTTKGWKAAACGLHFGRQFYRPKGF